MPCNYALVQSIEKLYRYMGDGFRVSVAAAGGIEMNLHEVASLISGRLIDIFRRDASGRRPCMTADSPFQHDRHRQDLILFYEYFHRDTRLGLVPAHKTGWTGLVANMIYCQYTRTIPASLDT